MRAFLLSAIALSLGWPLCALDKGRRAENPSFGNVPPTGVYAERQARRTESAREDQIRRGTEGEWRRSTERYRQRVERGESNRRSTEQYATGTRNRGRERAADVSRGKHKGWSKNKK